MSKTRLILSVVLTVIFSTGGQSYSQSGSNSILRPHLVDSNVSGAKISKTGDYVVQVGELIQIEYSYPVSPRFSPKEIKFQLTGMAIKTIGSEAKNVSTRLMGSGRKSLCMEATKPGTSKLKLLIDENCYEYDFVVKGKRTASALCKGFLSAIQFKGQVFVFGNGVHPTGGYETFIEKSKVAVWPPRLSLMCVKPKGITTQVLTPFSVVTSFESPSEIKTLTIADSDGSREIEVIQIN